MPIGRILIVDDRPYKCHWIFRILEELKIEYDFVTTLEEAKKKLEKNGENYKGIILDRSFPPKKEEKEDSCAGSEFLQEIKESNFSIPVLGNTTTQSFPNSEKYDFFKGKLDGIETEDSKNKFLRFLESIEKQS